MLDPMRILELQINGDRVEVGAPDHWTLLEVLRYRLGLTGSKQGCDKGDCGACTVLVDGQPVLACITLAALARGREVTTIEGLMPLHAKSGGTGPDPIQSAFDRCGALQCGFCQPGMMLSARALLAKNACPTRGEIREALAGNLCRCTGYTQIFEAVELAVAESLGVAPAPRAWEAQRMTPEEAQERARAAAAALVAERGRSGVVERGPKHSGGDARNSGASGPGLAGGNGTQRSRENGRTDAGARDARPPGGAR
jgi:aerobic-type carbon monoxide dehydrogenase small subunit (CoxS/CutS family)